MGHAWSGRGGSQFDICTYPGSRLRFRGPRRRLDGAYCAALGGTATFGKYILQPYPSLLEASIGLPVVNFGCDQAGAEAYLSDPAVLDLASAARLVVLQLPEAHNFSNAFYSVHPRRNDRFIAASPELRALYPDADFTEYAFVRHLLRGLRRIGPKRFVQLRAGVQKSWCAQMRQLIDKIRAPVIALWMPGSADGDAAPDADSHLQVTGQMRAKCTKRVCAVLELPPQDAALSSDREGMRFAPLQRFAAGLVPGPDRHTLAARLLAPRLLEMLDSPRAMTA